MNKQAARKTERQTDISRYYHVKIIIDKTRGRKQGNKKTRKRYLKM